MNSQLNLFYKEVLEFAGLFIDPKGYVRSKSGEKNIITVKDKLMVVPTRDHLRSLTDDKEVFHPLSENALTRIPEATSTFCYRATGLLNIRFAELIWELKKFCCSPKSQLNLTTEQIKIIRGVQGEEDSGSDTSFEKFIGQQLSKNPSEAFISIALARGAKFKGEKKSRVSFVTFPLYTAIKEDLLKPRNESSFPSLSKKKLTLLMTLYEAIFPGLDKAEEYGFGFESGIAPWFVTYMKTALGISDALNLVIETFSNVLIGEKLETIPLNWNKTLDDTGLLTKLAKSAPNTESELKPEPVLTPPAVQQPEVKKQPSVPFVGSGATPQTVKQTPHVQQPQSGRRRVSWDEWKNKSLIPSQMGHHGQSLEAARIYNEGYALFYNKHIEAYGVPPGNLPAPTSIPHGVLAPPYPGGPPQPMIGNQNQQNPYQNQNNFQTQSFQQNNFWAQQGQQFQQQGFQNTHSGEIMPGVI